MSSFSRQQLENWIKTIEVKGKVLDVGGSQNPVKGRTGKWEAEEYKILDLKNPHEEKVKPDIVWDLNSILGTQSYSWLANGYDKYIDYFDTIFCLEVSEYLIDPLVALKNLNDLLKKGGLLYISFHFLYPNHAPEGKDYLRYTEHGAVKLLEEAGFETVDCCYRLALKYSPQFIYEQERMRGLKGYNHNIIGSLITAKKC